MVGATDFGSSMLFFVLLIFSLPPIPYYLFSFVVIYWLSLLELSNCFFFSFQVLLSVTIYVVSFFVEFFASEFGASLPPFLVFLWFISFLLRVQFS